VIVGGLGACATQPITKLVGGRQITTRSIDPDAYEHASRAFLLEEQERWQEAADELQRALAFDGDSPELRARLAEVLLHLDRVDDAAAEVRRSLKIGISTSGLLAESHVCRAKADKACVVAALQRATNEVDFMAEDDDAENVYLELAEAQLEILDIGAAQATLETLCQALPTSDNGHMRLMAIDWAKGEMKKAEAQLQSALSVEPNQVEALAALAWMNAAGGKNDKARQAFREALDRSEGSLDIAAAFARFLVGIDSGKEAEQVADDLAVPDSSLDAESLDGRIELERSARRLDRALTLVARGREMDLPDTKKTRLSFAQASLLKEQDKGDAAVAVLMKVGKDWPLFLEARLRVAELLRDSGKAAEAMRVIEDAAKQAAGSAKADGKAVELDAGIALALAEERLGKAAAAVARLEGLQARYPGEGRTILALAAAEDRRGNWQRALALAETVMAKSPGSVEALNFWGFVAADHDHDLDLASKRLQVANALAPGAGGLLDSLGWVHFHTHDLGKADLFLEQAAHLEPVDPEIQWHLGQLYAERKEFERAAAAFGRSLGFHPDERLRSKVEASLARLPGGKRK